VEQNDLWEHLLGQNHSGKDMESLQQQIINEGCSTLSHIEKKLQSQIEERCQQEEMLWKQKSRISWLKEGECNTSFFHHSTIQHRMHNKISCLKKQSPLSEYNIHHHT
jgi:hypothetical protein